MHDLLVELLDKADLAIAKCREVLGDDDVDVLARTARDVRLRLAYPDDLIIVALAGGTGSGKSSIINAVAGEEVCEVGGVRPTTDEPVAAAGADRIGHVIGYIRELGIAARAVPGFPRWLVLVDMPDTDSVEVEHRHRVDEILPRIDGVVWVTDPEKYRDEVLHGRFLRHLAAYEDQFRFVLNQADRLDDQSVESVLADFAAALTEDGFADPAPQAIAANPGSGPPQGIDELVSSLEDIASRERLTAKLRTDLYDATRVLSDELAAPDLDFKSNAAEAIRRGATLLVADNAAGATNILTDLVQNTAEALGGRSADEMRALTVGVPAIVRDLQVAIEEAAREHASSRPTISCEIV